MNPQLPHAIKNRPGLLKAAATDHALNPAPRHLHLYVDPPQLQSERCSISQLLDMQLPECYHGRVQKVRKLTLRRGQTPRELGRPRGRTPSPPPRRKRDEAFSEVQTPTINSILDASLRL